MPPIESEADRASYFDDAEIAEIRGVDISGQFDERTELLDGVAPVQIQTTNPTFFCQSIKVPVEVTEGEPISVERQDGSIFSGTVVTKEPDGFGMTLLTLENNE